MSTLIFLDSETTGLDPLKPKQLILEIGLLAVSEPDFTEIDAWSAPLRTTQEELDAAGMDPFVVEMHTKSRLLGQCLCDPKACHLGQYIPTRAQAQVEAMAFVGRHSRNAMVDVNGRPEVVLCGANPDFDRSWLEAHMPDLARKFHYRSFDINSLWLLKRWLFGGERVKFGQAHRALDDCREAVATVHRFVEAFGAPFMARIAELEAQFAADAAARDALAGIPG